MIARGTYQARLTVCHPSTAKNYIHIAVIRERRQLVLAGAAILEIDTTLLTLRLLG